MILDSDASEIAEINPAVMNKRGNIALSVVEDHNGAEETPVMSGILRIENGHAMRYVDSNGPYAGMFYSLAVNHSGTLVFSTLRDSGKEGIFTSSDPESGRIIGVGDALFGSTVTTVGFGSDGLNKHDLLAFSAVLAEGRHILGRVHPHQRGKAQHCLFAAPGAGAAIDNRRASFFCWLSPPLTGISTCKHDVRRFFPYRHGAVIDRGLPLP